MSAAPLILTVRLSCITGRVGSSLLQSGALCDLVGQMVGYRAVVTGPHVLPHLPAYIPPGVDMIAVNDQVGAGGVSAPAGADIAGLQQVVAAANADGIDLKIVVIEQNPPIDTPLRDIATEVGENFPGSTVLAISPGFAGTYSRQFDRVTLEAGQDLAKTGDPVQSSKNFVAELQTPDFSWMPFTILAVLGVAVAAIFTRVMQVRAKRSVADDPSVTAVD